MRVALVAAAGAFLLIVPSASSARPVSFALPGGAVRCVAEPAVVDGAAFVRCASVARARGLTLDPRGGVRSYAAPNARATSGPAVAHGRRLALGPFVCTSRPAGMTCLLRDRRRGFLVGADRLVAISPGRGSPARPASPPAGAAAVR
jgi:hypothetical protein